MTYNTKNYTEQGGEKTVIGGTLEIKDEATVVGLSLIETNLKHCYYNRRLVTDLMLCF